MHKIIVLTYFTTLLCFQGPGPSIRNCYKIRCSWHRTNAARHHVRARTGCKTAIATDKIQTAKKCQMYSAGEAQQAVGSFVFSTETVLTNRYMNHTLQEILKQNSGYKGLSQLRFHCSIAESSSCSDLLPDPNPQPQNPKTSVTKSTDLP